ncbi:MAG: response regulator transcription factor [Elusimicrobiota bacterium]
MTDRNRILVIDDDEEMQKLIRFSLNAEGFQVFSAMTGRDGSQKAQTLLPDLILLDMVLPDLNGVEVLRLIQSQQKAKWIPVIVLTGLEDKAQVLKSVLLALGVVSFIGKPIAARELCDAVASALTVHAGDHRRMQEKGFIRRGPIRVDLKAQKVVVKGRSIGKIAASRYDLLCVMLSKYGCISKRELMHATGAESVNNIEKLVQRLRNDLGPDGESIILTVPGGYQIGD